MLRSLGAILVIVTAQLAAAGEIVQGWPEYGGGLGQRYSPLEQINAANVGKLALAWRYRSGDVSDGSDPNIHSPTSLEVTAITAGQHLVICTPYNRVVALNPLTGKRRWSFDPQLDMSANHGNNLVCRGVAHWPGSAKSGHCAARIFTATNDNELIALDRESGTPCAGFGVDGRVDLSAGVGKLAWRGEYQVTSPPLVVADLVVVGSSIADNQRTDAPSGVVRAYDARTGALRWAWDLAPPDFDYQRHPVSSQGYALGTPNVWAPMIADPERDLIFLPTGNPAPDFYRSGEPDMDYYGSAVVALRASSGEVVWKFNTVINDFWDYDVPAQPGLMSVTVAGVSEPAVVVATKMGFLFVLHRETGAPLHSVEYRQVPRVGPLASQLSPVQPFPPPAFQVAREVSLEDAWGLTFWDRGRCREVMAASRVGPIYTPITDQWTVVAPSNAGGVNWGGVAVDPIEQRIVARSSNVPFRIRLLPGEEVARSGGGEFGRNVAVQRGTPWAMMREPLLSPLGIPCTRPPWGTLTQVDIRGERQRWQIPLGTVRDIAPLPIPWELGVPGLGGPLLTRGGLIFIGAAMENVFRAVSADSGELLWQIDTPAGPQATPMTYSVRDERGRERQFVVIAAGGNAGLGSELGDYLLAYALPENN